MSRTLLVLALTTLVLPGCRRDELEAELASVRDELTRSQAENQTLKQKIASLEAEIKSRDDQLADASRKMGLTAKELEELRAEKRKREQELQVYKNLFAKLKKLIDAGTIQVVFRKGRMVVKLASAILFDSGKVKLKEEGQTALAQLVPALQSVGDRDFMVSGHTDNVPIKTRRYRSNWELSTARAVVVVNYMIEQGYPAGRLGAAGYGEHDPVSSNDDPETRAQNRRIEIALMPNLSEIEGLRAAVEGS